MAPDPIYFDPQLGFDADAGTRETIALRHELSLMLMGMTPEQRMVELERMSRIFADMRDEEGSPRGASSTPQRRTDRALPPLPPPPPFSPSPSASSASSGFMNTPQGSPEVPGPRLAETDDGNKADSEALPLIRRTRTGSKSPLANRQKSRSRPVLITAAEMTLGLAGPAERGLAALVPRQQLSEGHLRVKNYLMGEVRKQMYALIGYEGGMMPDESLPLIGLPGQYLVPNFLAGIADKANELIRARAARMVLAEENKHPDRVFEPYRSVWLKKVELAELARSSWPNMKKLFMEWRRQQADPELRNGLKERQMRRNSRRNGRAKLFSHGLTKFCLDKTLDEASTKLLMVHVDWVGEEWSADEDGEQNDRWRDLLLEKGAISASEREATHLRVFEERRPVWMDIKCWTWIKDLMSNYKDQRASTSGYRYIRTRRVDLGRVSHLMPSPTPYGFMLDPKWREQDLPKMRNWTPRTEYPSHLDAHIWAAVVGRPVVAKVTGERRGDVGGLEDGESDS